MTGTKILASVGIQPVFDLAVVLEASRIVDAAGTENSFLESVSRSL